MKYMYTFFSGKLFAAAFIVLLISCSVSAQDKPNYCVDCHKELDDEYALPAIEMENDIHFKRGIFCVDCHGGDSQTDPEGDPDIAKDLNKGYTGVIERTELPQFCDKCHGNAEYMRQYNPNLRVDQYQRYKTSIHGQRLILGDENVAICSDCHSVHQMRLVNNPTSKVFPLNVNKTCSTCHSDGEYMQSYAIPVDQDEKYQKSVHFEYLSETGDMFAPTCNDCHGNHGAVPPGVNDIHNICGTCHVSNKEFFDRSIHFEAFIDMDVPECVTCHSNHEITRSGDFMLNTDGGICWDCHDTDSDQGRITINILSNIEEIKQLHGYADSLISLAEVKGMEVSELKINLIDLSSNITRARNLVHTLSLSAIDEEIQPGKELAASIIQGGNDALEEISIRRTGLFISLLFLLLVILALYLKIRTLPKPAESEH